MKIFPCDIDVYTIAKDFLTIIIIPAVGIFFAYFYVRTKRKEIDEKKKNENELNKKLKTSLDNITNICKILGFTFNIKTNEFELKIGNGILFVHIPFVIKGYFEIFDNAFHLVHWNRWINKNHLGKNVEEQRKLGVPIDEDCKNIEEYIKKLIEYRKKQNDQDVE